MRGRSLKETQELLGHSDIKMTMRYAHLAPSVKRDAVTALDGFRGTNGAQNEDLGENQTVSQKVQSQKERKAAHLRERLSAV